MESFRNPCPAKAFESFRKFIRSESLCVSLFYKGERLDAPVLQANQRHSDKSQQRTPSFGSLAAMGRKAHDCWRFYENGKPGFVKQEHWDGAADERPKHNEAVYALRWLCFKSKLFQQLHAAKRLEYLQGMRR